MAVAKMPSSPTISSGRSKRGCPSLTPICRLACGSEQVGNNKCVDEVSFLPDLANQLLTTHGHGEKLVKHDPLVVPSTDPTSLFEDILTRTSRCVCTFA